VALIFNSNVSPSEVAKGTVQAPDEKLQLGEDLTKPVLGVLLPTEEALSLLREKLLSVFGVESTLYNQTLPHIHVQHDALRLEGLYQNAGPIPGNDFHLLPSITYDESAWSAWSAFIRLETSEKEKEAGSGPLLLRHAHLRQQPGRADDALAVTDKAARLIRRFWPDATAERIKRRMNGPRFDHRETPGYQMLSWLACKDLGEEGVSSTLLSCHHPKGFYLPYHKQEVRRASKLAFRLSKIYRLAFH